MINVPIIDAYRPLSYAWNYIIPLGCMHMESKAFDVMAYRRTIREGLAMGASFVLLGDNGDFILPGDRKRYRQSNIVKALAGKDNQIEHTICYQYDLLRPIKGHIAAVLMGNHEEACLHFHEVDPAAELAERLGVPYLGMFGAIRWHTMRRDGKSGGTMLHVLHHGAWVSKAAMPQAAVDWFTKNTPQADIITFAHNHTESPVPIPCFDFPRQGASATKRLRYIVACGTMRENYSSEPGDAPGYDVVKGMGVTAIGAPLIAWRRKNLCGGEGHRRVKNRAAGIPSDWIEIRVTI